MGKLIIIESRTDGAGKETQTKELYNKLIKEGYNVRKITFPNYGTASCKPVESYLNGDLGNSPSAINPYAISSLYANDRFFSYVQDWGKFYEEGGIIISDRYTTSNMIHQAAKIHDLQEKDTYLEWLYDLEFNKYQLPKPDCVIFLDVPLEFSKQLMANRANKITGDSKKDIHESDLKYLENCSNNSDYVANKFNWSRIKCIENNNLRSIEDIHKDIYETVSTILK